MSIIRENLDEALHMLDCTDAYEIVIEPLTGLGYLHLQDKYWDEDCRCEVEVFSLSTPRSQWGDFQGVMEYMDYVVR